MKANKENMNSKNKESKKSLLKDKRGLSTVEYIIILVLVAVGGIQLWSNFGDAVNENITSSTGQVSNLGNAQ